MSDESKFHDHLDECKQCREHPFALCTTGATLLRAEVTEVVCPGPFVSAYECPIHDPRRSGRGHEVE